MVSKNIARPFLRQQGLIWYISLFSVLDYLAKPQNWNIGMPTFNSVYSFARAYNKKLFPL
jgi:hypothetical protein